MDVEYESNEGSEEQEVEQPEEQPWSLSREEWDQMSQFQQQAMPVLQNLNSILQTPLADDFGDQQQTEEEEFDPFDQESVQNYIGNQIRQGIEASLGPFQGILGTVAAREGETLARGELDRISGEHGEFDRDTAFLVASGLIEQGHDPSYALESAAGYAREFEARIRADEREKYKKELETIAGAPQGGATGPASATDGVPVPTGPDRYLIAVNRALGNHHPVIPGG